MERGQKTPPVPAAVLYERPEIGSLVPRSITIVTGTALLQPTVVGRVHIVPVVYTPSVSWAPSPASDVNV